MGWWCVLILFDGLLSGNPLALPSGITPTSSEVKPLPTDALLPFPEDEKPPLIPFRDSSLITRKILQMDEVDGLGEKNLTQPVNQPASGAFIDTLFYRYLKLAITVVSAFIVTDTVFFLPEAPPLQFTKENPLFAVAVNFTTVPEVNPPVQFVGVSIIMVPLPAGLTFVVRW